ncbi:MAG TPA: IS110 family transposase [Terracidiphilus sp.]|jgi:transposase|nr:IS110 family transposase [Terracidiphilus sp.]
MSKLSKVFQATVFCGIDVSAESLAVAVQQEDRPLEQREFANSAGGHKALIAWLHKHQAPARVSLEATGIYSLDLAMALDAAEGIKVAVLNPKAVNRFAQSLRRSKTDRADAQALAEYSLRMPFVAWRAPQREGLQLRTISRHIAGLSVEHTREMNRLHAALESATTPRCVVEDLKRSLASVQRRMARLRRAARALVDSDDAMRRRFALLIGMPGIGEISALQLLGELAPLSPEMSVRQWVAHSGLDPAHRESGSSVHKPARISRAGNRHLRHALYMPALVAVQWDPHMKAFYELLQNRHKAKMQALVAVARKLLHAIYGIFKSGMPYDGRKLFPQLEIR